MMVQYDVKRVTKGSENFMVSFDFTKTPITQVADYIIIAASKNKTSDIHFDPREDGMMVRFRIDGDCQDYTFIPKAYERNLTTRIKLLANMNITETRLPQDGAIKGQFGDTYLDMRVACLPTNQGEKIVIRILDYTRSLQGIDSLGFHPKNLEKIHHMMGVPNGIILVTGATGSGKSTTTYSMLSALNKPEINVITVEDPVEMNIEGINQVQVNAEIGMTFAAALRSILREDPNVILIGEIRDSETAQIAVRASITGHLVMSTLHTNNALATVERLLDMDVERYLLSTALTGIISQRLAKQLCPECRYQREATKYEKKVYKKFLHQDISMVWDANPKGCDNCRNGYRGRLAVHEVLLLDDKIRNALNDEKMSKDDFAKMIYGGNTISMLQDALIKALEGQTSFEEVYKTIEIENEDEDNYQEELEGITINQKTEEVEEAKTDEDFMGEETQQESTLTQKYDIPGVTSAKEQNPVEQPTEQQYTETAETQVEQPTEQQYTETVETQVEQPTEQQYTETVETQVEQPTEQQYTETIETQVEQPVEQQYTETVETQVEQPTEQEITEQQEIVEENTFQMPEINSEVQQETQIPEQQEEIVEENTFQMPEINSEVQVENQEEHSTEQEIVEESTFEMPQLNSEENQTPSEQEASEIELPNYETINEEENNENNLGYTVAMPEETPQNFEEDVEQPEHLTEEVEQEEITQLSEEAEEDIAVTEENNIESLPEKLEDEPTEEINEEKKEEDIQEEKSVTTIEPIVDTDYDDSIYDLNAKDNDDEEQDNKSDNSIYDEEDPIEPTIEIKTDLDQLIGPNLKLEKLDMSDKEMIVAEKLSEDDDDEQNKQENTYDYEYDDYEEDFTDFDEDDETFFELNDEVNESSIPTMQALSAVADVTDINPTEERSDTGSNILSDPGIRIADDGSINQSAEINADPILPNYDDDEE
ncbi:MAG: Flp pilus assembly complex ATPase component TadA [Bacilli bacterium]|nr:Flp pilus assembly complex ATPase component TadA [Bacilli bacterium]